MKKLRTAAWALLPFVTVAGVLDLFAGNRGPLQPVNHPPVVRIVSPRDSATVAGETVHYEIQVSDPEDGDSRYDELNVREILLALQEVSDSLPLQVQRMQSLRRDPEGLALIRTSNCLACHAFSGKLTGPSFEEIRQRYRPMGALVDSLASRIRGGSTGIWGKTPMPTHPELNGAQARLMVEWILHRGTGPSVSYYTGTSGNIIVPGKGSRYLLTASYLDHGIHNTGPRLEGKEVIVITRR